MVSTRGRGRREYCRVAACARVGPLPRPTEAPARRQSADPVSPARVQQPELVAARDLAAAGRHVAALRRPTRGRVVTAPARGRGAGGRMTGMTDDAPPPRTRRSLADSPIALGPLDGRYRPVVAPLVDHLSEAALNRERVHVEVEWLIHLTSHHVVPGAPTLSSEERNHLRAVVDTFDAGTVAELAATERVTAHDVKAIEYLLKRRLAEAPEVLGEDTVLPRVTELVHFACTSEDINNLAYALMVRGAVQQVWLPATRALVADLAAMARANAAVPMLARTHGQPATPTTLGKELAVLAHRLRRQLRRVEAAEYLGKMNGATGTYGAHLAAVPGADWIEISRVFVQDLGLSW